MGTLIEGVREQFYRLLKEPVSDITARAWERSRELWDAMEDTKNSGGVAFVPLLDHSVSSIQHPKIEIMVGPNKVHTLDFDVELEIRIEGMRIKISAGRIAGMMAAQVQAKGSVKLGEYTLAEKSLEPVLIFGAG